MPGQERHVARTPSGRNFEQAGAWAIANGAGSAQRSGSSRSRCINPRDWRTQPGRAHSRVASQRRVTSPCAAWNWRTVGNPGGGGWSERSVK